MRSKYEVTPEAAFANGVPTLEAFGLSFERAQYLTDPYYVARLTDEELVEFWPKVSNNPFPGLDKVSGSLASHVHFFRNAYRAGAEPYTVCTIYAAHAADMVANGAAVGVKPQPAIAG